MPDGFRTGAVRLENEPEPPDDAGDSSDEIETTAEELQGFYIVKAILRQVVDSSRIAHRDVRSYFGILLDDNNRKPLARLHFNGRQKYLGLFDNPDKDEERIPIGSLDDIYQYAERLQATIPFYDEASAFTDASAETMDETSSGEDPGLSQPTASERLTPSGDE